jgi:hypothetical protein
VELKSLQLLVLLFFSGDFMKTVTGALGVLSLTILLAAAAPFSAHAVVQGAMKGTDPTYRGGMNGVSKGGTGGGGNTCSAAAQRCKKNFPQAAAACASAGASCKQTGTFTNPQGQSFSGLTKN